MNPSLLNTESSLDQFLASNVPVEKKINALNEYALGKIDEHNTDNFKKRAHQCKSLLATTNYPKGKAYNKVAMAFVLMGESKLMEMKKESEESILQFETLGDNDGLLFAFVVDVFGKLARGDFDKAFQQSIKAIKLSENLEKSTAKGWAHYAMAVMYFDTKDFVNSKKYYQYSAEVFSMFELGYSSARARAGAGTCCLELGEYDSAKTIIQEVVDYYTINSNPEGLARAVNDLGHLYTKTRDFEKAEPLLLEAYKIRNELNNKRAFVTTLLDLSELYICSDKGEKAIAHLDSALELCLSHKALPKEMRCHKFLYEAHKALGNLDMSFISLEKYVQLQEQISNDETNQRLKLQEANFVSEKTAQLAQLERKKNIELKAAHDEISAQNKEIRLEKDRSENLLLNILPEDVAEELKEKGNSDAQLINHVSVLFTDFKGFTALSEQVTPRELVADLHACFSEFDLICEKYGIEKIKTIGDAYMAAGGVPKPNQTHHMDVVKAALEMVQVVKRGKTDKIMADLPFFEVRIGIHTGPVVAGIVGIKKFQYDIWGDTVNTASRMESSGEVGKVNISKTTYDLLKEDSQFSFESRGKIEAKGKGEIEMYFVSKT
jgi:class 3 adenylate cyclase